MTKQERQKYSDKHIRRLRAFEKQYVPKVNAALRKQVKEVIEIVKRDGLEAAKRHLNGMAINTDISDVVMKIYKQVGVKVANETLTEINKSAIRLKGFGFNAEWVAQILSFFRLNLLNKAVLPISQNLRDAILSVLITATNEGWGVDKIVSELNSNELTIYRARTIVRTESGKAVFYGEELAKEKTPFETQEEWVAANDHRTRHSHHQVDGDVINTGGRYKVPVYRGKIQIGFEFMKGPGDPNASAANVINCRCKRATTARRDENGRLIRKRNYENIL